MTELQLSKAQEERAMALHKQAIVFDMSLTGSFAHPAPVIDGKAYLQRALDGGLTVGAHTMGHQMPDFRFGLSDVNLHRRLVQQHSDKLLLATRSEDFETAKKEGKIGIALTFQNGTPLEDDWLNTLPVFHALGVRVIQPTYNETNMLGSGCLEPVDIGLTGYGRQVVGAMSSLGMSLDLSHCGERTTMEAIEFCKDPVMMTHSNPKALNPSPRNKTDDIIKALAAKGGVIGIVAWAVLCETKKAVWPTVTDYVDHIEYVANLVGIDHVGLGSDLNENYRASIVKGTFETIYSHMLGIYSGSPAPGAKGFEMVHEYPNVTRALVARGFSDEDILKFLGGNGLRLVKQVWDRGS